MPRKIIQDVIPPKKSIRNIPIPERVRRQPDSVQIQAEIPEEKIKITDNTYSSQTEKIPSSSEEFAYDFKEKTGFFSQFKIILTAITILILGGLFAWWFVFSNATITVTSRTNTVTLDGSFEAKKQPNPGELPFSTITKALEGTKTIPATGEKKIEKRASGTIIVYNDYSTASQRLIKNTRFETPEGLIFRIDTSITVPGQTKKDGKTIPGSVEATIFADSPGEEYNLKPTDFTIPGFKGDQRFEKFYGRSKTETTGGFSGTVKTASKSELENARSTLKEELKTKLLEDESKVVDPSLISFDKLSFITFEELSNPEDTDIKIKATLNKVVFDRKTFSSFIAKQTVGTYNNEPVIIENIDGIKFVPDEEETAPWQTGNLPFTINGTTTIIWTFSEEKLKEDLSGKPKELVNEVFSAYGGIERAELSLFPSWQSRLPEDPNRIKIVTKITP